MVYKLVEINGIPKIKLSDEKEKTSLPGKKTVLRVYMEEDSEKPSFDVICLADENIDDIINKKAKLKAWIPFTQECIEVQPPRIDIMTDLLIDKGLNAKEQPLIKERR